MIKPTIGRKLWFHANGLPDSDPGYQPESAEVVYVVNDNTINLAVFNHSGMLRAKLGVTLFQGDGSAQRPAGAHAEWMPYQKGQAAKTEQVESTLANSVFENAIKATEDLGPRAAPIEPETPVAPVEDPVPTKLVEEPTHE